MKKVIQRQIDHHFHGVAPGFLQVGTTIGFDCYVKRFNGYVIIIPAGTEITEALLQKLSNHSRIYIEHSQKEAFQRYKTEHAMEGAAEASVLPQPETGIAELETALKKVRDPEARIAMLYRTGTAFMERLFLLKDEDGFPMSEILGFGRLMVDIVAVERYRFLTFLGQMSEEYSEAHHSMNVSLLSLILAKALNMSRRELEEIAVAAFLHDIGKRRVAPAILDKNDKLDDKEYAAAKEHVKFSVEALTHEPFMTPQMLSAVRYHHERLDGSGYPNRLVGNQIPVMAQIIALCDIFDALTTDRSYRGRYSSFEALRLMKGEMSRQINVEYVDHLIRLLGK